MTRRPCIPRTPAPDGHSVATSGPSSRANRRRSVAGGATWASPRVLLFLFGSKDGLIRSLLGRARADELAMLDRLQPGHDDTDLAGAIMHVWQWLADSRHRGLLTLWVEGYARSLVDPTGPWADFARQTVTDWLDVLARYQPASTRATAAAAAQRTAAAAQRTAAAAQRTAAAAQRTAAAAQRTAAAAQRTAALALLRGTLLDLLATGDQQRTTAAIHHQLNTTGNSLHQDSTKRTLSGPKINAAYSDNAEGRRPLTTVRGRT